MWNFHFDVSRLEEFGTEDKDSAGNMEAIFKMGRAVLRKGHQNACGWPVKKV